MIETLENELEEYYDLVEGEIDTNDTPQGKLLLKSKTLKSARESKNNEVLVEGKVNLKEWETYKRFLQNLTIAFKEFKKL